MGKNKRGRRHDWWLTSQNLRKQSRAYAEASRRKHQRAYQWQRSVRTRTSIIAVPKHLLAETEEQRAKLHRAIDSAFVILRQSNTRVRFDFSPVEKIFPGGMLVFLAYLEMLQLVYPRRVLVTVRPDSIAGQLLERFGLSEKLGLQPSSAPAHKSVVDWQYLTGTHADGERIADLLNFYKETVDAEIPEGLYDVLAEAFTNVRHHAFPASHILYEELKRWWLFARYVPPTGNQPGSLYIAVYDIGVGIQASLRAKLTSRELVLQAGDKLLSLISSEDSRMLEQELLRHAVEHPRTSTGLANRGLGLPEMKEFVMGTESGRLYILSGYAQYSCIASLGTSQVFPCSGKFAGTLILWSIPLKKKVVL